MALGVEQGYEGQGCMVELVSCAELECVIFDGAGCCEVGGN